MFLFHATNDILVDGSVDVTWVTNTNLKHTTPVRQSLYTDWNSDNIKNGCEYWCKIMINQSIHYNSVLIVDNSDTIFNLIEVFKTLAPVHIKIIKGTNNV